MASYGRNKKIQGNLKLLREDKFYQSQKNAGIQILTDSSGGTENDSFMCGDVARSGQLKVPHSEQTLRAAGISRNRKVAIVIYDCY